MRVAELIIASCILAVSGAGVASAQFVEPFKVLEEKAGSPRVGQAACTRGGSTAAEGEGGSSRASKRPAQARPGEDHRSNQRPHPKHSVDPAWGFVSS
jgi:hypothetical protein